MLTRISDIQYNNSTKNVILTYILTIIKFNTISIFLSLILIFFNIHNTYSQQSTCLYPQFELHQEANLLIPSWIPFTTCSNNVTLWDPSVIWDDFAQYYRLYFTRWNSCTQHMHIYTTESSDGITWNNMLRDIHDPLKEQSWGQGTLNNFETTSALQLNDSTFYIYFLGYTNHNRINKIGLLISNDYGKTYIPYENNPVLIPSQDWETINASGIKEPSVIYDSVDSIFKMWYNVTDYNIITSVGYATSQDGKNWEKCEENPVMLPLNKKMGEEWPGEVNHVNVVKDPEYGYHMFYANHFAIFQAYSQDGINWSREPGYYPQIMYHFDDAYQPCPGCRWEFVNLDAFGSPSVIFMNNGELKMFYMRTIPGAYAYGKNPPGVPGTGGMMLGLATGICQSPLSVTEKKKDVYKNLNEYVKVFPNPANDIFNFEIISEIDSQLAFTLYDIYGRIVLKKNNLFSPFNIQKGGLLPGLYFYIIHIKKYKYFRGQIIIN